MQQNHSRMQIRIPLQLDLGGSGHIFARVAELCQIDQLHLEFIAAVIAKRFSGFLVRTTGVMITHLYSFEVTCHERGPSVTLRAT